MSKYFYKNNDINIIHLCGACQENYKKLSDRLLDNIDITGYIYNEYDILSCWTDDNKCILKQQLDKYNIPLINCVPKYDFNKEWYMPNKIKYILDTLKKSNKDIILILDGYDVLFNSFKDIIKRFTNSGYKILYNATKYNYPKEDIGLVDNIQSDWRYFNAGCCIGYRKDLIKFYEEALSYINIDNPCNSEQYIIRQAFEHHKNKDIMFEYNPKIFITMGYTSVLKNKNSEDLIIISKGFQPYKKQK